MHMLALKAHSLRLARGWLARLHQRSISPDPTSTARANIIALTVI
jgi:hypothetical protein